MTDDTNNSTPKEYPPYQAIDQATNIANKRHIRNTMQNMLDAPLTELADAHRTGYHTDVQINFSHPINELSSPDAAVEQFWKPLRQAIPDVERRDDIVAGGLDRDVQRIGCLGHYFGTFEQDWFGIPATGQVVTVRFAEGHELREGKIAKSYVFIDFLDVMRQVGYWPIAPSLGREMQWLSPMTHDGVILTPQEDAVSARTHGLITRMHIGLDVAGGRQLTHEIMDLIEQEDPGTSTPIFCGTALLASAPRAASKGLMTITAIRF